MIKKRKTTFSNSRNQRQILKFCFFCTEKKEPDYQEVELLHRYLSERGKIIGRARSGVCRQHQTKLATAVKRARLLALVPFVTKIR